MEIIRRADVPHHDLLLRGSYLYAPLSNSRMCLLPYIDDLAILGISPHAVNERHVYVKQQLSSCGLTVHRDKSLPASSSRPHITCLGLAVHRDGSVTPKPQYLNALLDETTTLLHHRRSTPREMQRFLGRWVWPLLLRRPLLSVLSDLYTLTSLRRLHVPRSPNVTQLVELQVLLGLSPVIFRDLTRSVSRRFYATDTSPWGASVVYCDGASDIVIQNSEDQAGDHHLDLGARFRDARVLQGWYAFPDMADMIVGQGSIVQGGIEQDGIEQGGASHKDDDSQELPHFLSQRLVDTWSPRHEIMTTWSSLQWRTAILHRWRVGARAYHINVLELEALLLAVRHMGRSLVTRGKRVIVFLDSLVGLVALGKGRSPSRRLNRPCRKIAAWLLLSNIELLLHWVPTDHQPADAASRRYAPRNFAYHQILLALDSMSVRQRNAVVPQTFLVYLAGVLRFAAFCMERDLRAFPVDEVDAALHSFLV